MTNFIHQIVERHLTSQNHIKPRIKGLYERDSANSETAFGRIRPRSIDEPDFTNKLRDPVEESDKSENNSVEENKNNSNSFVEEDQRTAIIKGKAGKKQENQTTLPGKTPPKDLPERKDRKPSDDIRLSKNERTAFQFKFKNLRRKQRKDRIEESDQEPDDLNTTIASPVVQNSFPVNREIDEYPEYLGNFHDNKQESSVFKRIFSGIIPKQQRFRKTALNENVHKEEFALDESDRQGNSVKFSEKSGMSKSLHPESEIPFFKPETFDKKNQSDAVPENSFPYSTFSELKNKMVNDTDRKLFASGPLNVKIQGNKVESTNNQVIQVNIGQIIVKANKTEKPPTKVVKEYKPDISLNDYLNKK